MNAIQLREKIKETCYAGKKPDYERMRKLMDTNPDAFVFAPLALEGISKKSDKAGLYKTHKLLELMIEHETGCTIGWLNLQQSNARQLMEKYRGFSQATGSKDLETKAQLEEEKIALIKAEIDLISLYGKSVLQHQGMQQ